MTTSPAAAIAALEPEALQENLDREGFAITEPLIDADTCAELAQLYAAADGTFRSTVTMARHGFGSGEYKYFARPLPDLVTALRSGRLQLPASGSVRRNLFPPASHPVARSAGHRFRRR
jgi:hypothetical protein